MGRKVKITVTESRCRSGFHKAAKKVYRLSFLKRYVISRIRIVLRKKRGLKCGKDNAK